MDKESSQLQLKNKELMDQVEQLKMQLQLLNEKKIDSLNQSKPIIPNSQVTPIKPDLNRGDVLTSR